MGRQVKLIVFDEQTELLTARIASQGAMLIVFNKHMEWLVGRMAAAMSTVFDEPVGPLVGRMVAAASMVFDKPAKPLTAGTMARVFLEPGSCWGREKVSFIIF